MLVHVGAILAQSASFRFCSLACFSSYTMSMSGGWANPIMSAHERMRQHVDKLRNHFFFDGCSLLF
jgi:hypothetical protein